MQIAQNWEKIRTHSYFSESMGINSLIQLLSTSSETIEVEVIETEVIKEKLIEDPNLKKQLQIERQRAEKAETHERSSVANST